MNVTKPKRVSSLISFLVILFVLNILFFPMFVYFVATIDFTLDYFWSFEFRLKQYFLTFFAAGATILWLYCIFFFYKYDRYSKNGLGLVFLPGLISPFYFVNVIWKQKRPLQNK